MCGIIGAIGYSDKNLFEKALNKLFHRGPDGFGIWHSEEASIGHRRLAILDLSENAKQPMQVLGRYIITFNGEIYNYRELRIELEKKGYQFISNSDTEVLLYAFIEWKEKCLHKLNGMWAFAIWDKTEKSLFLSRDRVGKKPLFYSMLNNSFAFASEMKAIYPLLKSVEVNYDNLNFAIKNNFLYEVTEKCLIKNIYRFPAGSFGVYKDEKLTIEKFWFPLEQTIPIPINYNEQVEIFRELFIDSCKLRMRSDVTIGTALSGGIDSSAVICTMNHIAKNNSVNVDWQHAFVATFPGTVLDETEYAKVVTDSLNIKADFVEINPIKELDDLFRQAYMFEEIFYAPTIPFVQLYGQERKRGVVVSIDGHGADELFGGYTFDLDVALIDTLPNISQFKQIADTISNCYLTSHRNYLNRFKFALSNKYSILGKFSKHPNLQKKYKKFDFLNSRLYESTYMTILPTLLRNYDRYSMMNGVEIRMPFLDYRILQFAFSIPYSSKIRNGYTKAIIRDALKGVLPEKVRTRKTKIGFNSPIDIWVQHKEFKEWLNDEMNSTDFNNSSVINSTEVKNSIAELLNNQSKGFTKASALFEEIIPYIWEKGLKKYAN